MRRTRSALLRSAVSHDSTVGRTAVGRESQQRRRRTTLDLHPGETIALTDGQYLHRCGQCRVSWLSAIAESASMPTTPC